MTPMMDTIETIDTGEQPGEHERTLEERIAAAAEAMRALKAEKMNLPSFYEQAVRRTDTGAMVRVRRRMVEIDEHIAAQEVTIARLDVERARRDLDEALAREGAFNGAEYDRLVAARERKRDEYEDAQRACIRWQGALQGAQHTSRHRRERLYDANARLDALIARITQTGDRGTTTAATQAEAEAGRVVEGHRIVQVDAQPGTATETGEERTADGHRVLRMGRRPDGAHGHRVE